MNEISNNDFLVGFKKTFENSMSLYESAIILEKSKKFGIACSLLILSAEECIKSNFLFIKYFAPEIEIDNFKKVFGDHKYKIDSIRSVLFYSKIFNAFEDLFYKPLIDNIINEKVEQKLLRKECLNNLVDWLNLEAKSSKTEISKLDKWWKFAKTLKEDGFYVSFNQGKFGYPSSIKINTYIETKKQVEVLLTGIGNLYKIDYSNIEIQSLFSELKYVILKTN